MNVIVMMGIQATGKTSFYRHRFFNTHLRLNLAMLRTRKRESVLFETCLRIDQPVVIDSTNVSRETRARFIDSAQELAIPVYGYFFESRLDKALERNARRSRPVPEVGVRATHSRLEMPQYAEGFDELFWVSLRGAPAGFEVISWEDARPHWSGPNDGSPGVHRLVGC